MKRPTFKTAPAFAHLHRTLSPDELAQLEGDLDANGIISPLVVWKETGVLLDGHNRNAWAQRKKVTPPVTEISFADESAAVLWAIRNQLARRNLAPEEATYLRGRAYNLQKGPLGANQHSESRPQNGDACRTVQRLAKEYGVSKNTIERDGQFAAAVDEIGAHAPELAQRIRQGKSDMSHGDVLDHARLMQIDPSHASAAKAAPAKEKPAKKESDPELELQGRIDEVAQAYGSLCMFLMKMERLGITRRREYWEHFDKESSRITKNGLEAMRRDADDWLAEITP